MAILYQVGILSFRVYPLALLSVSRAASADFAAKEIVGGPKPREAVGPGDETISFRGVLTPYHSGGMSNLAMLDAMRLSQEPQPVLRGDGKFCGFFVITEVAEEHNYLEVEGIGQVIGVGVTIVSVPAPSFSGLSSILLSLIP